MTYDQRSFCLDTFNALALNERGNLIFSPYSLSQALFMLYVGARGDSANRIKTCLKIGDGIKFHIRNRQLNRALATLIHTSNGLYASDQYKIMQEYIDVVKCFYGGEFRSVNFRTDATNVCTDINKRVSVATQGMIDNLLSEINPAVMLLVVNAIYFKGKWKNPFIQTTPQLFRTGEGILKTVDTMHQLIDLKYYRDTEAMCEVLHIPYKQGAYMYIILPFQDDINAFQKTMTSSTLTKWTRILSAKTYKTSEIHLALPKFKLEYSFPLKEIMITLGLGHLFDYRTSQLCGITDSNICVTDGVQKVVLQVDEKGTIASAATAMLIDKCSKPSPIQFKVDRSFMFMIREDTNDVDLFWGKVTDPIKASA